MVLKAFVQRSLMDAALGASRVAATCSVSCIILNCDSFVTYNGTTALILPQVDLWKKLLQFYFPHKMKDLPPPNCRGQIGWLLPGQVHLKHGLQSSDWQRACVQRAVN